MMKKLIIGIIASIVMLTFVSCDTYAQVAYSDDVFTYEYTYNRFPVKYIDGVAYYYCMTNNIWRWVILPEIYYGQIIHHPRPLRYIHNPRSYRYHNHGVWHRPRMQWPDRIPSQLGRGGRGNGPSSPNRRGGAPSGSRGGHNTGRR